MTAFLAAVPLLAVLLLMGVLRWSAAAAGAAGLTLSLILAATAFNIAPPGVPGAGSAMAGILLEAAHATAAILWIILPALLLYEYQERSGAYRRIRGALRRISGERTIQALLIAWFFGLFMEGAAGFGTPVALAAPLLVGIGFSPAKAVILALIGHAAGVAFGAVGTPALAQVEIAGLGPRPLAAATASVNAGLAVFLPFLLVHLAAEEEGKSRGFAWAALAAACFLLPYGALAVWAGPELPTLAGALLGFVLFVLLFRLRHGGSAGGGQGLIADLSPYLLLVALVLATRLLPALRETIGGITLDWRLHDVFTGSFAPFFHPGSLLFVSIAIAAFGTGRHSLLRPAGKAALLRLAPVALALLLMLTLSRVMVHAGMIDALAEAAAGAGGLWPALAPFVGAAGTFVSGSATASNVLFTEFQVTAAETLALPVTLMAAAQAVGAGIGNIVAPHNIIAGCATVGLAGAEGGILRSTAPVALAYLAAAGLLVLLLAA